MFVFTLARMGLSMLSRNWRREVIAWERDGCEIER